MYLKIGYVKAAVTPPIGVRLEGYADRVEPSSCIYDDLYIRCLSIGFRDKVVAIAVADLIGIPYSLYVETSESSGMDILLGATHSHSTPSPYTDDVYRGYLIRSIAGCVRASAAGVRDIPYLVVGRGLLPQLVYNRRKPVGGAIDAELTVIDSGIVSVVNFTAHPVILGPDNLCISSDYPGAVERFYRQISGRDAVFLNGCCGNVNPYTATTDLSRPYDRRGGSYGEVERYGRIIALESVKAIELGEKIDVDRCGVFDYTISTVNLRLRREAREFIESVRREDIDEVMHEMERRGDLHGVWRLRLLKAIADEVGGREYLPTPIAAINLCNTVAMVFLPAEVFVEHQLYIKSRSPFKYTAVSCYFNSYWMYIPTAEAFSEEGYELQIPISIIEPGEGEKLREEAVKLLQKLYT